MVFLQFINFANISDSNLNFSLGTSLSFDDSFNAVSPPLQAIGMLSYRLNKVQTIFQKFSNLFFPPFSSTQSLIRLSSTLALSLWLAHIQAFRRTTQMYPVFCVWVFPRAYFFRGLH